MDMSKLQDFLTTVINEQEKIKDLVVESESEDEVEYEVEEKEMNGRGLMAAQLHYRTDIYNCDKKDDCSICLNDMNTAIVRRLVCKHVFHIGCIDKWFSSERHCPICRDQLMRYCCAPGCMNIHEL
jgi:hypothetical protein